MSAAINRQKSNERIPSAKTLGKLGGRGNKEERYRRRKEFSHVFKRALDRIDPPTSQEAIAQLLETKQVIICYFGDPHRKDSLAACDIPVLPREAALHILEYLARQVGHTIAMLPDPKRVENHLQGLAELTREMGEVSSEYASALADGHVSRQEAARIAEEAREALLVLESLYQRMTAAFERGGEMVWKDTKG